VGAVGRYFDYDYRRRICQNPDCNESVTTLEVPLEQVRAWQALEANPAGAGTTLPTPPTAPLIDLEDEMEDLLAPAVEALRVSLHEKDPSKARVDVAKFVISDRREYRRGLAQVHGVMRDHIDSPDIAQLANVLRLVE
jgi:hypothetical protein